MMNQLNKNLIHTPCTLQLGTVMMTAILNPRLLHCHYNIREYSVLRATIIINYVLYLYRYVSCVQMCKCFRACYGRRRGYVSGVSSHLTESESATSDLNRARAPSCRCLLVSSECKVNFMSCADGEDVLFFVYLERRKLEIYMTKSDCQRNHPAL